MAEANRSPGWRRAAQPHRERAEQRPDPRHAQDGRDDPVDDAAAGDPDLLRIGQGGLDHDRLAGGQPARVLHPAFGHDRLPVWPSGTGSECGRRSCRGPRRWPSRAARRSRRRRGRRRSAPVRPGPSPPPRSPPRSRPRTSARPAARARPSLSARSTGCRRWSQARSLVKADVSSAAPPGPDGRRRRGVPTLGEVTIAPLPPGLRVRTRPVDDPGGLLDLCPDAHPLCWVRDGEGLVGWGEVARFTASGPERFAAADHWWRSFAAELDVRDDVGGEGTGPIAFTSFTFADSSPGSVVVVPRVIVGRVEGRAWITEFVGGDGPAVRSGAPGPAQRAPAVGRRPAAGRGLPHGGRRGGSPHAGGRAGQGGARARPAGRRRGAAGPALPARRARAALPVVLVVRRRRAGRRDARAAHAAQRRDGLVAGTGGHGLVGGDPLRDGHTGGPGGARAAVAVVGEGPVGARARGRVARGCAAPAVRRARRAGDARGARAAQCVAPVQRRGRASWTTTIPRRCCASPPRCTRPPRWAARPATPRSR